MASLRMNDQERKIAERDREQRIAELERALSRERERSTAHQRHAEALEDALKRSYRFSVTPQTRELEP